MNIGLHVARGHLFTWQDFFILRKEEWKTIYRKGEGSITVEINQLFLNLYKFVNNRLDIFSHHLLFIIICYFWKRLPVTVDEV